MTPDVSTLASASISSTSSWVNTSPVCVRMPRRISALMTPVPSGSNRRKDARKRSSASTGSESSLDACLTYSSNVMWPVSAKRKIWRAENQSGLTHILVHLFIKITEKFLQYKNSNIMFKNRFWKDKFSLKHNSAEDKPF